MEMIHPNQRGIVFPLPSPLSPSLSPSSSTSCWASKSSSDRRTTILRKIRKHWMVFYVIVFLFAALSSLPCAEGTNSGSGSGSGSSNHHNHNHNHNHNNRWGNAYDAAPAADAAAAAGPYYDYHEDGDGPTEETNVDPSSSTTHADTNTNPANDDERLLPKNNRQPPPPPPPPSSRRSVDDETYYVGGSTAAIGSSSSPPPYDYDSARSSSSTAGTSTDAGDRYYRTDEYPGMEDDYALASSSSAMLYPPPSSLRPPPIPGPPPPQFTSTAKTNKNTAKSSAAGKHSVPIHYEFPARMAKTSGTDGDDDDHNNDNDNDNTDGIGIGIRTRTNNNNNLNNSRASPRNDVITRYMSTTSGKLKVHLSSTLVGGSTGVVLAKSFLPFSSWFWGTVLASMFLSSSLFLRTAFGELVRAVGLSILLVLQRTRQIRRTYPTWRYVPAALVSFGGGGGGGQRRRRRDRRYLPPPFPPARNPWRYTPRRRVAPDGKEIVEGVEFNMLYSMVAMAMVGSTCGANLRLPMIPTWMGSLAGAGLLAVGCTLTDSPRGDLCRTLGMRVVALVQELWEIQAQLGIVPKAAIVSGQVIDRLMILDRQHKVKDRFLRIVNAGYAQALSTVTRIQDQRLEAQGRPTTAAATTTAGGAGSGGRQDEDHNDDDDDEDGPPRRRPRPRPLRDDDPRMNISMDRGRRQQQPHRRRLPEDDDDDRFREGPVPRRRDDDEMDEYGASGRDGRRSRSFPPPPPGDDDSSASWRDDVTRDRNNRDYEEPPSKKRGWFGGR